MWCHPRTKRTVVAFVLLGLSLAVPAAKGDSELISRAAATVQPTANFSEPTVSSDGRFVAFRSFGPIFVPGDTSSYSSEVYVRDRALGRTLRASLRADGSAFSTWSTQPRISANGRFVAFVSDRSLSAAPGGGVFVRDLQNGTTELASVDSNGQRADGAGDPAISSDGRFVAFTTASALVPADDNARSDVYLRDRVEGRTELISVNSNESPGDGNSVGTLSMSGDGRFVAFTSFAHNLVPGDTNVAGDVFVRDRALGTTERVSVSSSGAQAAINKGAALASISADGRFVAFLSHAWNLVREDTNRAADVFVHDRATHRTERVSISTAGIQGNASAWPYPSISPDGRFVSFVSSASNLVAGDTNGVEDVFVRDQLNRTTTRVARVGTGGGGLGEILGFTDLTAGDSGAVVYATPLSLAGEDTDGTTWDVYLTELAVAPAVYAFTLKPMSLDFGERALGTSSSMNFWLRNKGTTPLPLLRVEVRGEDRAMFTAAHSCGASLDPGAGCAITVTFVPTATDAHVAKVVVVAGDAQVRVRWVHGSGVQAP